MGGGGRGVMTKQNLQVPHSSPPPKGGEFLAISLGIHSMVILP